MPCSVALAIGYLLAPGADLSADAVAQARTTDRVRAFEFSAATAALKASAVSCSPAIPSNIFQALSYTEFRGDRRLFHSARRRVSASSRHPPADDTIRIAGALFAAFSKIFEWILAPSGARPLLPDGGNSRLGRHRHVPQPGQLHHRVLSAPRSLSSPSIRPSSSCSAAWTGSARCRSYGGRCLISFLANNPIIALRPTITSLVEKLKAEDEVANTVLPFGIIASQHGQIINIILLTMFLANMYGVEPFGGAGHSALGIGGMIGGTAVVGGGATLAPVMAPILGSVGVPGDMAIVVLGDHRTDHRPDDLAADRLCRLDPRPARARRSTVPWRTGRSRSEAPKGHRALIGPACCPAPRVLSADAAAAFAPSIGGRGKRGKRHLDRIRRFSRMIVGGLL